MRQSRIKTDGSNFWQNRLQKKANLSRWLLLVKEGIAVIYECRIRD